MKDEETIPGFLDSNVTLHYRKAVYRFYLFGKIWFSLSDKIGKWLFEHGLAMQELIDVVNLDGFESVEKVAEWFKLEKAKIDRDYTRMKEDVALHYKREMEELYKTREWLMHKISERDDDN